MARTASIERVTKETQIRLSLNIDGTGEGKICTSVPFLRRAPSSNIKKTYFNLNFH